MMALLMLSPLFLVLGNLWSHALRNSGEHRKACWLLILATFSGLILIPIATDYGRWLSAIVFCNFFALFFLVSKDVIKAGDLVEYTGGAASVLFVSIILMYLLFGPFHDWNPYPYRDNVVVSAIAVSAVLLIDIGLYRRWRTVRGSHVG
jgi:O-antigen/teichoic acid export membrane protein